MQGIHTIAEERIFADSGGGGGGGGGTGDRRLRPLHHRSHQHQALKCPRCDSLNTKFCYFNNYNLSQPRHFCKNCRRYWTKGGVLRNVPIGGGCRKTKRSKPKSSAPGEPTAVAAETDISTAVPARERKTNSRSSSESSSLTATTTPAAVEAVSATSSITPSSFFSVTEYKSISAQSMDAAPINHGFEQFLPELTSGCGLFSDVENFSNLITSSVEQLPFGFSSVLDQDSYWDHQQDQEQKIQQAAEIPQSNSGVFPEQTTPVDPPALLGRQPGNEEFGPLYWPPGPDQGLSNLPGAVDQAFWSRNSQWADEDHQAGLDLP